VASALEKKRLRDHEKRRVSELELAVDQIRICEERLRLALKLDRAQTWDWDLASNRVHASGERTFEEALTQIHPGDRERIRERLFHAVEHRTEFHERMRLVRRDGSIVSIEVLGVVHLDAGGRGHMIGVTRRTPPDEPRRGRRRL
jgi:hypothetical protein